MSRSVETPWKPATSTIWPRSRSACRARAASGAPTRGGRARRPERPRTPSRSFAKSVGAAGPGGYNFGVRRTQDTNLQAALESLTEPAEPRWIVAILALVSIALLPWVLWLTVTLPSSHV